MIDEYNVLYPDECIFTLHSHTNVKMAAIGTGKIHNTLKRLKFCQKLLYYDPASPQVPAEMIRFEQDGASAHYSYQYPTCYTFCQTRLYLFLSEKIWFT